jgi:hypothetical protein
MQPTDTEILWLNLTNAGLGLATLAGIAALAWAVVRELGERAKSRVAVREPLDPHAAFLPELGLTMADGGEKVEEKKTEEKK